MYVWLANHECVFVCVCVKTAFHINTAAMHAFNLFVVHQVLQLPQALHWYRQALTTDLRCAQHAPLAQQLQHDLYRNIGTCLFQMGHSDAAIAAFTRSVPPFISVDDVPHNWSATPRAHLSSAAELAADLWRARKAVCDWSKFEHRKSMLRDLIRFGQLDHGLQPSLLPFDTLLVDFEQSFKSNIAKKYASKQPAANKHGHWRLERDARLRIGYFSHDFTDHPTAHLMEGLFHFHNMALVDVRVLSYGKDDRSRYRESIKALTGKAAFVNIAELDHETALKTAKSHRLDVCFDAQVHTMGSRPSLMAGRPCGVQANYLVYPGTAGSHWHDYIVVDAAVVPPQQAQEHFSEKIVYLPQYQANYYSPSALAAMRTPTSSSPHQQFTYCNFNKVDKLEPASFSVWMNILSKVPTSTLMLLKPSTHHAFITTKHNIAQEAAAHGVIPDRIVWVNRVAKELHLSRHANCDVFLDSIVYNAHSTCTDALFAGLPVVALRGTDFASRVASSLLSHIGLDNLIVHSLKEYEDVAVALSEPIQRLHSPTQAETVREDVRRHVLRAQRCHGACCSGECLFDAECYTTTLERASFAMAEMSHGDHAPAHIVLQSRYRSNVRE